MPGCNNAGAVEKRYSASKVRGCGRECQAATVQERPRGATPRPRAGAVAERSNPTSKERRVHGCRRAERSYSMFKVRRSDSSKVSSSSCTLLEQV